MSLSEEDKFPESVVFEFLRIVKSRKSFATLTEFGLFYSQIADLIMFSEEKGYISVTDDSIELNQSGIDFLRTKHNCRSFRRKENWIAPLEIEKVEKIGIDMVWLPDRKTISSLK